MANTGKYAGSETEKNLYAAFAGETQARSKYTYFASVAKKQGFEQIAELFQRTADNEKEHAKLWFEAVSYTHLDVYKRQPFNPTTATFSPFFK